MATLLSSGGRRSTAPVFDPQAVQKTQALNLGQLLQSLSSPQQAEPQSVDLAIPPTRPQPAEGSFDVLRDLSQASKAAGLGMQVFGKFADDPAMRANGTMVSDVGAYGGALYGLLNADSSGDYARAAIPAATRAIGVPVPYAAMIQGAVNNGPKGAVAGTAEAALSVAFPPLGIVNAISGLVGGPTIGSLLGKFLGIGKEGPPPTQEEIDDAILSWFGSGREELQTASPSDPTDYATGGA